MKHKGFYLTEIITHNGDLYARRTTASGELQWYTVDKSGEDRIEDDTTVNILESKYKDIKIKYYSSVGIMSWAESLQEDDPFEDVENIFLGLSKDEE